MQCQSFEPIIPEQLVTLILGSMPGVRSLEAKHYYAHTRNAFWHIMSEVCKQDLTTQDFSQRYQKLKQLGIGLWDVVGKCERVGSLDSAINPDSIIVNPIAALLREHPECQRVITNGNKATTLFKRHILISNEFESVQHVALPSTSPANARMTVAEKTAVWIEAIQAPFS